MTDTPETQPLHKAPGQMLKRAREAKNLTVAAIATQMNLDLRIIEALEAGDQSRLPAPIFVRGYLRGYARQVGISEAEVLDAYQAQAPQEPTPRAVGMASAPLRPAYRVPVIPWRGLLLTAVVIGLALLGFAYGPQLLRQFTGTPQTAEVGAPDAAPEASLKLPVPESADPAAAASTPATPPAETAPAESVTSAPDATGALELPLPAPPPSPERDAAPQSAEPEPALSGESDFGTPNATPGPSATPDAVPEPTGAAVTETETAATAPGPTETPAAQPQAPGAVRLGFTFNAESWVEVRDADGGKLLFDLMRKGETREVSGKAPISVLVGNAHSVELRVNGERMDLAPHSRDNIARLRIEAGR